MLITGFPAGLLACNCYVVAPGVGADAIIVDPGQSASGSLRRILDEHRLTPAAVLLTHGHIDHIWSAQKVADHHGCPVYIHPEDRAMLTDPVRGLGTNKLLGSLGRLTLGALFREPRQLIELDRDGAMFEFGGIPVTVDHTPGHTLGSVSFRIGGQERSDRGMSPGGQERSDGPATVLTGDTLFRGTVGRTDLPGGSGLDLLTSIVTKLLVLDDDTVVLPGHGEKSTIGIERRTNPFLEGLRL